MECQSNHIIIGECCVVTSSKSRSSKFGLVKNVIKVATCYGISTKIRLL